MRLRPLALTTFALALLAPGLAAAGLRSEAASLERERSRVLAEIELARPELGSFAAELLRERAELVRRSDQLDLVATDAFEALDAIRDGLLERDEGGALLLRSPSAVLLRQEDRPQLLGRGRHGGVTWTRGSWMDSPDGASN